MSTATFSCHYFNDVLNDLEGVIEEAKADLADIDFDTLVGTGFSGGIVIPSLALALGKNYVLIRKESDDSHHGGGRMVGKLGERWIFVDDFISSGRTYDRVRAKIADGARSWEHETVEVGSYMYRRDQRFQTAEAFRIKEQPKPELDRIKEQPKPKPDRLMERMNAIDAKMRSAVLFDQPTLYTKPVKIPDGWTDVGYLTEDPESTNMFVTSMPTRCATITVPLNQRIFL